MKFVNKFILKYICHDINFILQYQDVKAEKKTFPVIYEIYINLTSNICNMHKINKLIFKKVVGF